MGKKTREECLVFNVEVGGFVLQPQPPQGAFTFSIAIDIDGAINREECYCALKPDDVEHVGEFAKELARCYGFDKNSHRVGKVLRAVMKGIEAGRTTSENQA